MSLRNINLNLLPMLQALLREQSVSAAADSLGLTQPAVSAALARLRVALGDPLLVKVGRRMELTSRARDLIGPVDRACEAIDVVLGNQPFEPALAQRVFIIASADHGPLVIAPPLMRRLEREAPGVTIQFIDLSLDLLRKSQDRGVEFFIAPRSVFEGTEHAEFEIVQITPKENFVAVIGPNHRLAGVSGVQQEALMRERHVLYHPGASREHELAELVSGHLPGQFAAARFQQFTMLPVIASLTDTVAIVPRRVAERLQEVLTIQIIEDEDAGLQTDLCLAWSPVYAADPAHVWLRTLIMDVVH